MIVYENGLKKHVKRLKAPTRMVATNVVPDKLYLAQLSFGSWTLVKVQCVKEPGWLRGHVNVRGFYTDGLGRYCAWVTVEPINGDRHLDMLVTRLHFEEPWTFADDQRGTLMEPSAEYFGKQIADLLAENRTLYEQTLANIRAVERLSTLKANYGH